MVKVCRNPVSKPLSKIFNDCLDEEEFPSEWKKACIVSVHKKREKQYLKKYRPNSFLLICIKILERIFCNGVFTFFTENNLIAPNQSRFRLGGSCINQLRAIIHEIYKMFDNAF